MNHTTGCILGDIKLNQQLSESYANRLALITGQIIFRMLVQEQVQKLRLLYKKIKKELDKLSIDLQVVFKDVLLVVDNGFETLNLGHMLNKRNLSGNFTYKVINK